MRGIKDIKIIKILEIIKIVPENGGDISDNYV